MQTAHGTLYTPHCTRYFAHCILDTEGLFLYIWIDKYPQQEDYANTYDYTETHDYWFLYLFSFILVSYSNSFPFIVVLSKSTPYTLGTFPCGFWSCTFSIFC